MNREERDLLIRALAPDTDPDNARGVLSNALETLSSELYCFGQGTELHAPERAGDRRLALLALSARADALKGFADSLLDVNFKPLKEGGAS